MHVRDQIVDAIAASLREAVPEAAPRVYVHGRVDWDGRTYPVIVISATSTRVEIDNGMQRRETQVVVEIHEVEEAREDYVDRIGDMSSRVEKAMADLPDAVPVEDVILVSDTGVKDLDEDADRLYAATASTFAVAYYTEAGDASRMIAPNY